MQEMQEMWVWSLGLKDPLEKEMATHSIFFPGESCGQRSLEGYSSWGCKELNMTEQLNTHTHTHTHTHTVVWGCICVCRNMWVSVSVCVPAVVALVCLVQSYGYRTFLSGERPGLPLSWLCLISGSPQPCRWPMSWSSSAQIDTVNRGEAHGSQRSWCLPHHCRSPRVLGRKEDPRWQGEHRLQQIEGAEEAGNLLQIWLL